MKLTLQENEKYALRIFFDPNYRKEYLSRQLCDKLIIDYLDHPSSDVIELSSVIHFPNLEFSQSEISFGSILNHTECAIDIEVRNRGPLPVKYRWWFEVDENSVGFKRPISSKTLTTPSTLKTPSGYLYTVIFQ